MCYFFINGKTKIATRKEREKQRRKSEVLLASAKQWLKRRDKLLDKFGMISKARHPI